MDKPLKGLKVLEMGTLIGGPYAGRLLAEFGAEVIKIEPPEKGDPIRKWRMIYEGTSLWWYVHARNKKSVTLNLKEPKAQEIVRKMVEHMDIVVENFRPGTLEKWGLGYEDLKRINPGIIMVRVSGYGQTGPYHEKAGYGSIGEAMGGIRYLTGFPDRPPTRTGISLGDSIASMYGVIGALMAVYYRDVLGTGKGQVVDVALYEAVFSLMESMVPEYNVYGFIRERSGSTLPGIAPSNSYLCKDNKYIVIGGNGDTVFKRLMTAIGRQDVAEDERFVTNDGRVKNAEYLDEIIESWTKQHMIDEVLAVMDSAKVPAGKIFNVKDIVRDPQYLARNMIEEVDVPGLGKLKIPGIVPKLTETPGGTEWSGPVLGAHTEEVLRHYAELTDQDIAKLKEDKLI